MLSKCDGLHGVRVALLESRMADEMASLVRRHGGIPRVAAALHEARLSRTVEIEALLERLDRTSRPIVIFLSGVGATALFEEADRQHALSSLVNALANALLVCRGPKPATVLKRHGLSASIAVAEPYTSTELLAALRTVDCRERDAVLVHYGERNETIAGALRDLAANVHEICLYEWRLPADLEPLRRLIGEIVGGQIDAIVFTSQIQGRHLVQVARDMKLDAELGQALNRRCVVAAVGPTCCDALAALGIQPRVVPRTPKMAPLVRALAEHFSSSRTTP